jgi:FG-GAP-like repeat
MMWPLVLLLVARSVTAASILGAPSLHPVDGGPVGIATADVNALSVHDVITLNEAGDDGPSMSFLLNPNGDADFAPEERLNLDATHFIVHAVATGDFNGDGAGDVAVAVDDITVFPIRATVLVYLNDGSGQYLDAQVYPLNGLFPQCLKAGDVNADGVLDLVVCYSADDSGGGMISVLTGQQTGGVGTGLFAEPVTVDVGTSPTTVAVADVDQDQHVDLVVGDPDDGTVLILYGNGASSLFNAPVKLSDLDSPTAVAVLPDASLPRIVATNLSTGEILVFRQLSARIFEAPATILADQPPSDLAVADFNADGHPDLAVLSLPGAELSVWLGAADGSFTLDQSVSVDQTADAVLAADLNNDGKPDVALSSLTADRVTIFLNGKDAPGAFTPTPTVTPTDTPVPTPTPTRTSSRTPTPTATATGGVGVTPTRTTSGSPVATATPTRTPEPSTTPGSPGDANCDGRIDANDINALVTRMFAPGCGGADVDGDKHVAANDLLRLIQLLAANGQ